MFRSEESEKYLPKYCGAKSIPLSQLRTVKGMSNANTKSSHRLANVQSKRYLSILYDVFGIGHTKILSHHLTVLLDTYICPVLLSFPLPQDVGKTLYTI